MQVTRTDREEKNPAEPSDRGRPGQFPAGFFRAMRFCLSRNRASALSAPRKVVLVAPPPPPDEPDGAGVAGTAGVAGVAGVEGVEGVVGALAEKSPSSGRPPKRLLKAGRT